MVGKRIPGSTGLQPDSADPGNQSAPGPPTGGFTAPGSAGIDFDPEPLADRFVTKVARDWDPTPNPDTTPIVVSAANLADLAAALGKLKEAGEGGGKLRSDPVTSSTSGDATVTLHGNLVNRVVQWD